MLTKNPIPTLSHATGTVGSSYEIVPQFFIFAFKIIFIFSYQIPEIFFLFIFWENDLPQRVLLHQDIIYT
jgi:hypothetical protein